MWGLLPNFAELIAELCRTNCRTLYGRTTRDLLSNFAELIAELCTVRFGTVRPNFDPYSSAERRISKIRVRPITIRDGFLDPHFDPTLETRRLYPLTLNPRVEDSITWLLGLQNLILLSLSFCLRLYSLTDGVEIQDHLPQVFSTQVSWLSSLVSLLTLFCELVTTWNMPFI